MSKYISSQITKGKICTGSHVLVRAFIPQTIKVAGVKQLFCLSEYVSVCFSAAALKSNANRFHAIN